jgi:hypothetical protein
MCQSGLRLWKKWALEAMDGMLWLRHLSVMEVWRLWLLFSAMVAGQAEATRWHNSLVTH